jgi:hypothetical protein
MICELVRQGKKIGITALSHKVIRNLLEQVVSAAEQMNLRQLRCVQKVGTKSDTSPPSISEVEDNPEVLQALQAEGVQVAAGTSFLWSRQEFFEAVDVLFVDEAGQMSLANVLAMAQAAKSIVLLGDPQQLDQPLIDLCINNVIDQRKKEGSSDCTTQPRSCAGDVRMLLIERMISSISSSALSGQLLANALLARAHTPSSGLSSGA